MEFWDQIKKGLTKIPFFDVLDLKHTYLRAR